MPLGLAVSTWTASPQTHRGNTRGLRWRERVVRPGLRRRQFGMESNHLPARQDESSYDAFVDPRTASPAQGGCLCAWLPPGLAEEPEHVQLLSEGHSCIQLQSRWVIALFVGVRHSGPHIRGRVHLPQ